MSSQSPYYGHPGPPPPPYGGQQPTPTPIAEGPNWWGIASIVLAVLALAMCWIPFVGFVGIMMGLIGAGLALTGLVLKSYTGKRVTAIVGMALSVLAMILSFVLPIVSGMFVIFDTLQEYSDVYTTRPVSSDAPDESSAPNPVATATPTELP